MISVQVEITLLKATLHIVVELMQPSVLTMASQLHTEGIHDSELLCGQQVLWDGRRDAEGLLLQLMGGAQQAVLVAVRCSTKAGQAAFPCDQVQVFQDAVKHAIVED